MKCLTWKPSLPHLLLCFYLPKVGGRPFSLKSFSFLPCLTEYHFYIFDELKLAFSSGYFPESCRVAEESS